ncbi:MAG: hypothetical protein IJM51_09125 [Clostridia bacterium]|nr:hypothetical protein [Clostridia bacterium]
MKKAIKLTAVVLSVILLASLLTSCKKNPSDTAAFKQLAEKSGFEIHDVTQQYADAPQIKEATVVAPSSREFQIEFYVITDKDSAKQLYLAQSEVVDGYKDSNFIGTSSNGQNYARRTVVTNGKYLMVSYIENTMVYVPPTDKTNKDAIEKFLKNFGY